MAGFFSCRRLWRGCYGGIWLYLAASGTLLAADSSPWGGQPAVGQRKIGVCAACHGADGNAAGSVYPKLASQHETYLAERLQDFKTNPNANPIMRALSLSLSDQDLQDIGAYFASLPRQPDPRSVTETAGRRLYQQGDAQRSIPACQACHGPDGRGNPGVPYPNLRSQHADYLMARLEQWQGAPPNPGRPPRDQIMPLIAKRLSARDIQALAHYLATLPLQ